MNTVSQELRAAARGLLRRPGSALLACLILTAGLALTFFALGAVDAYLLQSMPFPEPDRLVRVTADDQRRGERDMPFNLHDFMEARGRLRSYEGIAGFYTGTINLSGDANAERYDGAFLTANAFAVLGTRPELGRDFRSGEDAPGAAPVVIISHELWRDRFGADPGIVGRAVRVNGRAAEVIGVMPQGFHFPNRAHVWTPAVLDASVPRDEAISLPAFARLLPGVTIAQAEAEMRGLAADLARERPELYAGAVGVVRPFAEDWIDEGAVAVLSAMLVSVALVLLIACANVANVLLVRAAGRQRELAVRAALGAGRARLMAPVLAEASLITTAATVAGFWLGNQAGRLTIETLRARGNAPYWIEIAPDWRTAAMAIAVAALTTLIAGLLPALRASSGNVAELLRGGRGLSGSPLGRLRSALVLGEITLSCVVLATAGLLVRSLVNLGRVDLGADTHNVLAGRIGLFPSSYPTRDSRTAFFRELEARLEQLPGVEAATVSTSLPGTLVGNVQYRIEGRDAEVGPPPFAHDIAVAPDYFDMLRIPLLAGRGLDPSDDAAAPPVAVVSARMAELLGGPSAALGARLRLGEEQSSQRTVTVVGVVPQVIQDEIDNRVRPAIYVPLAQSDERFASVAVRTRGNPAALSEDLRRTVASLDPDLPVYWLQPLDVWIDQARFMPRFFAFMFGAFGLAGLVLAAGGVFAVLAQTVVSRTGEIGLRRALGASGRAIVRLLFGQTAWQLGVGLVLGLVLAAGLGRVLSSVLIGVGPFDPVTFMAVALVIAAASIAACLVPATRALSIEPAQALRYE